MSSSATVFILCSIISSKVKSMILDMKPLTSKIKIYIWPTRTVHRFIDCRVKGFLVILSNLLLTLLIIEYFMKLFDEPLSRCLLNPLLTTTLFGVHDNLMLFEPTKHPSKATFRHTTLIQTMRCEQWISVNSLCCHLFHPLLQCHVLLCDFFWTQFQLPVTFHYS